MKKLIVFDLDGTLAESKAPLDPDFAKRRKMQLGVESIQVRNPDESKRVIEALLACMGRLDRHVLVRG